jgi:hypothetical protein
LSHESGTLQGGSSQQITLRFSPVEVEDVSRVLCCHMPEIQQALAAAAAAPSIPAPAARPGSAAAAAAAAAAALKPLTREVTGKVCTGLAQHNEVLYLCIASSAAVGCRHCTSYVFDRGRLELEPFAFFAGAEALVSL